MILDELAAYARHRVDVAQQVVPLERIKADAYDLARHEQEHKEELQILRFSEALSGSCLSFICEIKRASPSKGLIAPDFPYVDIACEYEQAGAECISCLTEPKWFLGSDEIFTEIRAAQKRPMIRKDFTVDPYQIYEAKLMGAQAVLLICSLLTTQQLEEYLGICDDLHLDALVETHDEHEIASAVEAGARIIGVNNRNLKDFSVDFENAKRLRELIPPQALYVAESGVKSAQDVADVAALGADAVLIGEALMRAADKAALLAEFRAAAQAAQNHAEGSPAASKSSVVSVSVQGCGSSVSKGECS